MCETQLLPNAILLQLLPCLARPLVPAPLGTKLSTSAFLGLRLQLPFFLFLGEGVCMVKVFRGSSSVCSLKDIFSVP